MPAPESCSAAKSPGKPARREDEGVALIQDGTEATQTPAPQTPPTSRSLLVHWDLHCVYKVCI